MQLDGIGNVINALVDLGVLFARHVVGQMIAIDRRSSCCDALIVVASKSIVL